MLTLTDRAATALRTILAAAEVPPGAGVRLATSETAPGEPGFELTLVEQPAPGDRLAGDDPRVYVDAAAVALVDGRILDADAVDGAVSFHMARRAA